MANLPLAFAELLVGAILVDAGIKGASPADVVKGIAKQTPFDSTSGATVAGAAGGVAAGVAGIAGAAVPGGASAGGYVDPFGGASGVTTGRTDQGVDYSAPTGTAINAIGAGKIVDIIPNWYAGQPWIEELLSTGSHAGEYVYYAEQLTPSVQVGDTVAAGERVGTVAASGTGLELGFGAPGGQTLARSTTGYTEGQATTAGTLFKRFLASLGRN